VTKVTLAQPRMTRAPTSRDERRERHSGRSTQLTSGPAIMLSSQQETTMLHHETLTDEQLDLVSGGDTPPPPPPPPPKTCVQDCERVENSSAVVCGPVICF
jgi:hypothetical protein